MTYEYKQSYFKDEIEKLKRSRYWHRLFLIFLIIFVPWIIVDAGDIFNKENLLLKYRIKILERQYAWQRQEDLPMFTDWELEEHARRGFITESKVRYGPLTPSDIEGLKKAGLYEKLMEGRKK